MIDTFVETELETPSGAHLQLYSRMPERGVKAAIHINHGMAEHAARYARFARLLSRAGFAVFAHDHRGHGKTHAPDAPRGVFADDQGFDAVISDVLAVNKHIRARDHDVPVILFGHSMGSIIALNFALRYPERVDALACWNAGVETGGLAKASRVILGTERLIRGRNRASGLARSLTFTAWNKTFRPNRTDFDWLSRDPEEVDTYIADPDCGFDVSVGLWLDLLDGIFYAGKDQHLKSLPQDLPVHIQGGGDDPCSNKGKDMAHLAERMKSAGMADVSLHILPETRHESLNETNRDQVMVAFMAWLEKRFG